MKLKDEVFALGVILVFIAPFALYSLSIMSGLVYISSVLMGIGLMGVSTLVEDSVN